MRLQLWPTLFTIPAVLIMISLGVWQLQRLAWKTELIETFETRANADAVAPPLSVDDFGEWRFRRVLLAGTFLHDKELQRTGQPFDGTAGFHVLTPFRLAADDRIILVNRGWVPSDLREPVKRPETLTEGPVEVVGIIRQDRLKGYFVPDNEPGNEIWMSINISEMATARGLDISANYYVDALRPDGPRALPIGATTKVTVRNEHLQYAITWFLLAITLAVIFVLYHRSQAREEAQ